MADELHPDAVNARTFRTTLRGFDTSEVRAFLDEVAVNLRQVIDQRDRLAARLGELGERDLKGEFAAIGQEVGEVLEAARRAAEGMRDRAATDAARWRAEAMADAEIERRQAKSDAENLRSDAWTTAGQLLEQVQREAQAQRAAAERDIITVRGSAEREAHRLTAAARREAEDVVRAAKMEAERTTIEAAARHDEIIESARRQAESAQERARALEQRREELLAELENLRGTLSRMEGELDERRQAIGLSTAGALPVDDEGPLRVVRPDRPVPGGPYVHWEPGETIRIVSSRAEPLPLAVPDAEEMAAEVRRLRESATPAPEPLEDSTTAELPPPEVEPAPAPSSPDELGDLFRRLRGPAESPSTVAASVAERAAPMPSPTVAVPEPVPAADPFTIRERLLLPITNRALRAVKHQLTEEQNLALEELRVKEEGWQPSLGAIGERLRADLIILAAEGFAAGHAAAGELSGRDLPRPPTPSRDVDGAAVALTATLLDARGGAAAAGHGVRQLSATISRIFRAWRTDEAERRIMDLAHAAYHDGVALSAGAELTWVVSGRGCATCRATAEERADRLPPAHPGCSCTVVPA